LIYTLGQLSILVIIGYVFLKISTTRQISEKEREKLIANNDRCQSLIYDCDRAFLKGKPIMTYNELQNQLRKIIEIPEEKKKALDNIQQNIQNEIQLEIRRKKWEKNRIKTIYKYEIEVYEIFYRDRELPWRELILKIESKFNISNEDASKIFEIWKGNRLIEICPWSKGKVQIGDSLIRDRDDDDYTWEKWIKEKGLTLKPESKEALKYQAELDNRNQEDFLPF